MLEVKRVNLFYLMVIMLTRAATSTVASHINKLRHKTYLRLSCISTLQSEAAGTSSVRTDFSMTKYWAECFTRRKIRQFKLLSLKSFDLLILKINQFSFTRQQQPCKPWAWRGRESDWERLLGHRYLRRVPGDALHLRHDCLRGHQAEAEERQKIARAVSAAAHPRGNWI